MKLLDRVLKLAGRSVKDKNPDKLKDDIVNAWVAAIFATYPLETVGFLRSKDDPFANPVAHMTRESACALYDAITGKDIDQTGVKASLDRFVRFIAAQQGPPGQKLAVIYLLKPILREKILPQALEKDRLATYLDMESRLDTLALLAFDMFMEDREAIATARIKEIKSQHAQLARWAQKLERAGGDGPES